MSSESVHPCFNPGAGQNHGRIHLPVAAKCNIQCNYCNRKTDCPNESRPGVTSTLLTPYQALNYLRKSLAYDARIAVAAIAGPGDAFASPEETMATLQGVRREYPELVTCLSTNGLALAPYIAELKDLGVRYITLTVNGIDPAILQQIYAWVRDGKKTYRGIEAANLMLSRQMDALEMLKSNGFTIKVNTVVIPGVNDQHIPEIARQLATFHIDRLNCIPLLPTEDTAFASIPAPEPVALADLIHQVGLYVPVMSHCKRCRSDAAGILGENDTFFQEILREAAVSTGLPVPEKVAVASQEGVFVNMHLGQAQQLHVFARVGSTYRLVDQIATLPKGLGDLRWSSMADDLQGVGAVLVSGVGGRPRQVLEERGISVYVCSGMIEEQLVELGKGHLPKQLRSASEGCSCGSGPSISDSEKGTGCSGSCGSACGTSEDGCSCKESS